MWRLRSWKQRWFAYWDLQAARRNWTELGFRESNGDLVLDREWREAEEWLRTAKERQDG